MLSTKLCSDGFIFSYIGVYGCVYVCFILEYRLNGMEPEND